MTFFRLPLVIWSLFITAILLLLALPVLTTALALLLFDRLAGTHFFIPSEAASRCCGSICCGSSAIPKFTSDSAAMGMAWK